MQSDDSLRADTHPVKFDARVQRVISRRFVTTRFSRSEFGGNAFHQILPLDSLNLPLCLQEACRCSIYRSERRFDCHGKRHSIVHSASARLDGNFGINRVGRLPRTLKVNVLMTRATTSIATSVMR